MLRGEQTHEPVWLSLRRATMLACEAIGSR